MASSDTRGRWGPVLRYAFGGVLLLFTVAAASTGAQWYLPLIGFCMALIFILGRRRIFRPAVNRSGHEIVCRYIPWYEGNAYILNLLIPLMGVAAVGAGFAPGNPAWLRYVGIILLVLVPLFVFSALRMWHRCVLRISPSMLIVSLAAPKDQLTEIRRECVLSIEPTPSLNGQSGSSPQVEISYRTGDLNGHATKKVLLGPQLTVQPINLLNALIAWKDGDNGNANELLDLVERILRRSGEKPTLH